ncbi:MAG: hypothetical protein WDM79_13215 [Terricaulis sp.]
MRSRAKEAASESVASSCGDLGGEFWQQRVDLGEPKLVLEA